MIAYIVPSFGIERQDSTNVKTEMRFGNGLRVYIHRPWYSSGEQELLGAVLWPAFSTPPTSPQREQYKHLITQWGLDPVWQTEQISEMPAAWQFSSATQTGSNLTLEESTILVDVAGHNVGFDASRKLWYCDITFENPSAYTPFVRLALARYQPALYPGRGVVSRNSGRLCATIPRPFRRGERGSGGSIARTGIYRRARAAGTVPLLDYCCGAEPQGRHRERSGLGGGAVSQCVRNS